MNTTTTTTRRIGRAEAAALAADFRAERKGLRALYVRHGGRIQTARGLAAAEARWARTRAITNTLQEGGWTELAFALANESALYGIARSPRRPQGWVLTQLALAARTVRTVLA